MSKKTQIQFANSSARLGDLVPCDWNPRKITAKQRQALEASLKKFPEAEVPVINTDNKIVAGHQRIAIYVELYGVDHEIDVRVPNRKMTDAEVREYNIRSNANRAEWDPELLTANFGMDLLEGWGFDGGLLDEFFEPFEAEITPGKTDDDHLPDGDDVPAEPANQPGDLWLLGRHRLLCGDATSKGDVETLLAQDEPILMVTDPPYGVKYDPAWREGVDLGVGKRSKGKVKNDDKFDWREAYELFPGDVAYVWHADRFCDLVAEGLRSCGLLPLYLIVWVKQHFVMSRGDYHSQHEPCLYAVRKGKKHNWHGDRKQTTVWEIKNNNSFGNSEKEETWGHGTQKPVECMLKPILNNTAAGEAVYDPFLGSGTTMIAAEKSGRSCFGLEINPAYCDLIIRRWEKFTGEKAVHATTKETFADVAKTRLS